MDRDKLNQRLVTLFLEELEEHKRNLEQGVLALESAESPEPVLKDLFRSAHSLKGAAQSIGANDIGTICHELEHIFQELLQRSAAVGPNVVGALLTILDSLNGAAARLRPAAGVLPAQNAPRQATGAGPEARRGQEAATEARALPAPMLPPLRVHGAKFDALLSNIDDLSTVCAKFEHHLELVDQLQHLASSVTNGLRRLRAEQETHSLGRETLASPLEDALKLDAEATRLTDVLRKDFRALQQAARRVNDDSRRLRMVPFAEVCSGFERAVRDLSIQVGKELHLTVSDADIEVDRAVAQQLRDPILHLLRNAASHGIEEQAEREKAGKPRAGQLTISASLRGSELEVMVGDDGRGLDLQGLRARAERLGVAPPADDADAARLVFISGLSTASSVTPLAGRGVGLDAVRRSVESLHGAVHALSERGRGAQFHLRVPLIIGTLRCMVVSAGGQVLAIPCSQVARVVNVRAKDLHALESAQTLAIEGASVPVLGLSDVLGLNAPTQDHAPGLILSGMGRSIAFVVDELLGEGESVLRPLPARLQGAPNLSGIAKLASGRIALVLNASDLCRAALRVLSAGTAKVPLSTPTRAARILVVDDSLTTRTLLKSVLEGAGYEVSTASDGSEAWRLLQYETFSVVVSDVQMPNMDGILLTQAIRRSAALARLPVVLVTALGSDDERKRGLDAGATAYLVKTAFDQEALLEAVARHA